MDDGDSCQIESVTPTAGGLIVDCSVHGEIGSVLAGRDEGGRIDRLFAEHAGA